MLGSATDCHLFDYIFSVNLRTVLKRNKNVEGKNNFRYLLTLIREIQINYFGKIEPIRPQVRNVVIVTLMPNLVKITQFIEKGVFQFSKY